jgi:cytochrome P450
MLLMYSMSIVKKGTMTINKGLAYYQEVIERRTKQNSVLLTPDIYHWYQEMQKSHRVYYDEARASWLVFQYKDVQQVLSDTQTFSSERTYNPDGSVDPIANGGLLGMDPPRHRQVRALIAQAFTPRMVAQLKPRITAIVEHLLDQIQGKGQMDVVDDLAFPLPITVIAELLGVPESDREQFRRWSNDFTGSDYALRIATAKKIGSYFQELIEQRRRKPGEDLMTRLLLAEVDGEHLPEQDILGTCLILLVAGHETTTGLISNALVCLDEHPEVQCQLVEQPELLSGAIEEVLRYRAVIHVLVRVVTRDTVLCGQQIKAGNLVIPLFASANLDEAQFPHAERFDIGRTPNQHLGFGFGIHFCLGAALARLETRIALEALLERFPGLHRDRTVPLELRPSASVYGLKHLPVLWEKK